VRAIQFVEIRASIKESGRLRSGLPHIWVCKRSRTETSVSLVGVARIAGDGWPCIYLVYLNDLPLRNPCSIQTASISLTKPRNFRSSQKSQEFQQDLVEMEFYPIVPRLCANPGELFFPERTTVKRGPLPNLMLEIIGLFCCKSMIDHMMPPSLPRDRNALRYIQSGG